jgi:hypothetical protein
MKRLFLTSYEYRDDLDDDDFKDLTKTFAQLGTTPRVIAHYERLDGRGGYLIEEVPEDDEKSYELTLRYGRWLKLESVPITTMADAFPVMQRVYG